MESSGAVLVSLKIMSCGAAKPLSRSRWAEASSPPGASAGGTMVHPISVSSTNMASNRGG